MEERRENKRVRERDKEGVTASDRKRGNREWDGERGRKRGVRRCEQTPGPFFIPDYKKHFLFP